MKILTLLNFLIKNLEKQWEQQETLQDPLQVIVDFSIKFLNRKKNIKTKKKS